MAKKIIFAVGFNFPGGEAEDIPFNSDRSLQDADIVVYSPTLGKLTADDIRGGEFKLSTKRAKEITERLAHWRSEIDQATKLGKTVFVILDKPFSVATVDRKIIGSYSAITLQLRAEPLSGKTISVVPNRHYFNAYWKSLGPISKYETVIQADGGEVLLTTRHGDRVLGAAFRTELGAIIFLPPLIYDEESFTEVTGINGEEEEVWNEEAEKFGKRWISALVNFADGFHSLEVFTPAPEWAEVPSFRLATEISLQQELAVITTRIDELQQQQKTKSNDLAEAGKLRGLLYESGPILEEAILKSLRLFGFSAENVTDNESEFDAVFVSPEGRFLGEAEGKDRSAINIDKLSQLERNIQEDFQKDGVEDFAKGVLFGNSYRLSPLGARAQAFTDKCLSGAKRTGIALVRTQDMFNPARYLAENVDPVYASRCREAFIAGAGQLVEFPEPPSRN